MYIYDDLLVCCRPLYHAVHSILVNNSQMLNSTITPQDTIAVAMQYCIYTHPHRLSMCCKTVPNLEIPWSRLPFHVKIRECSFFCFFFSRLVCPYLFSLLVLAPLTTNECLITKSMHLERCSVPAGIVGQ